MGILECAYRCYVQYDYAICFGRCNIVMSTEYLQLVLLKSEELPSSAISATVVGLPFIYDYLITFRCMLDVRASICCKTGHYFGEFLRILKKLLRRLTKFTTWKMEFLGILGHFQEPQGIWKNVEATFENCDLIPKKFLKILEKFLKTLKIIPLDLGLAVKCCDLYSTVDLSSNWLESNQILH